MNFKRIIMKKIIGLVGLIVVAACNTKPTAATHTGGRATAPTAPSGAPRATPSATNLAKATLTAREQQMVAAINRVRTQPQAYIKDIEAYIATQQQPKTVRVPTITTNTATRNGIKTVTRDTVWQTEVISSAQQGAAEVGAARELIAELQKTKPMPPLQPIQCLCDAAKGQGKYCQRNGKLSHAGERGNDLAARINAACAQIANGAENLGGGADTVEQALLNLLLDTRVPSRNHRKNLLNATYLYIGVSDIGKVGDYDNCWIQDFGS